ncbi:hypothetical protein BKA66DRAFT_452938 [Pyrenochaeta sp. MPI-SDFR-AT-0127]|nr:hypothetical protein BKA66DRAFT_452938 [Pyrenochaeta sp. MPI-SDFR-AT-0127]
MLEECAFENDQASPGDPMVTFESLGTFACCTDLLLKEERTRRYRFILPRARFVDSFSIFELGPEKMVMPGNSR